MGFFDKVVNFFKGKPDDADGSTHGGGFKHQKAVPVGAMEAVVMPGGFAGGGVQVLIRPRARRCRPQRILPPTASLGICRRRGWGSAPLTLRASGRQCFGGFSALLWRQQADR
jgi:hypothetical protein